MKSEIVIDDKRDKERERERWKYQKVSVDLGHE